MWKCIYVDSRLQGFGSSWYYGGVDFMSYEELKEQLSKKNAAMIYDGKIYKNLDDVPLHERIETIMDFGMPTNKSITLPPQVMIVPYGTKMVKDYLGRDSWEFPEDYQHDWNYPKPDRDWRKNP